MEQNVQSAASSFQAGAAKAGELGQKKKGKLHNLAEATSGNEPLYIVVNR